MPLVEKTFILKHKYLRLWSIVHSWAYQESEDQTWTSDTLQ